MKLKNNYHVKNVAGTPNRPTTRTYKTSCKSFVLALLFMVKYLLSHGDSKWLGIDIRNEVCTFVIPISSGKNQNIQKLILSRNYMQLLYLYTDVKIYFQITTCNPTYNSNWNSFDDLHGHHFVGEVSPICPNDRFTLLCRRSWLRLQHAMAVRIVIVNA